MPFACGVECSSSGWARSRAGVSLLAAVVLSLGLAVMAAEAQGLMWLKPAQQPIEGAASWVQPWLPASRAVWGKGPFPSLPVGFQSLEAERGSWSLMQCDALNYAQGYWVLHLAVFAGVVILGRGLAAGADRGWGEPGPAAWAGALTISGAASAAVPWVGQVMWTFTGAVERAAIAAVARPDSVTGNLLAENPSVPATGPFARGGIIVGCVLLHVLIVSWVAGRARRKAAGGAGCAACGYPVTDAARHCPECGPGVAARVRRIERMARAGRAALATAAAVFLLSPFVLGWVGAALPDEIWAAWVPF